MKFSKPRKITVLIVVCCTLLLVSPFLPLARWSKPSQAPFNCDVVNQLAYLETYGGVYISYYTATSRYNIPNRWSVRFSSDRSSNRVSGYDLDVKRDNPDICAALSSVQEAVMAVPLTAKEK